MSYRVQLALDVTPGEPGDRTTPGTDLEIEIVECWVIGINTWDYSARTDELSSSWLKRTDQLMHKWIEENGMDTVYETYNASIA